MRTLVVPLLVVGLGVLAFVLGSARLTPPAQVDLLPGGYNDLEETSLAWLAGDSGGFGILDPDGAPGLTSLTWNRARPLPLERAFGIARTRGGIRWILGLQDGTGCLIHADGSRTTPFDRVFLLPSSEVYTSVMAAPRWLTIGEPALLLYNARRGRIERIPLRGDRDEPEVAALRVIGTHPPQIPLPRCALLMRLAAPPRPRRLPTWLEAQPRAPRQLLLEPQPALRFGGDQPRTPACLVWARSADSGQLAWHHLTHAGYGDQGWPGPVLRTSAGPGDPVIFVTVPDGVTLGTWEVHVSSAPERGGTSLGASDAPGPDGALSLTRPLAAGEWIRVTHTARRPAGLRAVGTWARVTDHQPRDCVAWATPRSVLLVGEGICRDTEIDLEINAGANRRGTWSTHADGTVEVRDEDRFGAQHIRALILRTPRFAGAPVRVPVRQRPAQAAPDVLRNPR